MNKTPDIDLSQFDLTPAEKILTQERMAHLLAPYGSVEYKMHTFTLTLNNTPQPFSGLFVYLNHNGEKVRIGLWGALNQWKETEVVKLVEQLLATKTEPKAES